MNNEDLVKLKQYLADNYKENIGLGEQLLDFITENNFLFSDSSCHFCFFILNY